MQLLDRISRLVDRKPWAAHIYATDRCNLACQYCNEYDNDATDPPLEEVKAWMLKLRELGVMRLSFLGGEPLLHPDIVELVSYAKQLGFFKVGMSTNGFLLTPQLIKDLERAGLDNCQISVDRMTPSPSTHKSLKTLMGKIELFEGSRISMVVTGVLFRDTLDESRQVIDTCLKKGIGVSARLVDDDLVNNRNLHSDLPLDELRALLEYQIKLKGQGERIHTSWRMLNYQMSLLQRKPVEWRCVAGYKYFSVTGSGKFWPCSQLRTEKHIMDITPEDLLSYDRTKSCQDNCGVYCIVGSSFMFNKPIRGIGDELREMVENRLVSLNRRLSRRSSLRQ
jgi:MoaA/NifB/PqqE/SkfB family radical SAM enzyme